MKLPLLIIEVQTSLNNCSQAALAVTVMLVSILVKDHDVFEIPYFFLLLKHHNHALITSVSSEMLKNTALLLFIATSQWE